MSIAQLHVHSENSEKDSIIRIPELCLRAQTLGYSSVAITDHGTVSGWPALYRECKVRTKQDPSRPLSPIFGCELYVTPDIGLREKGKLNHLIVLAQTRQGLRNISDLVSASWNEGFFGKPRVDFEMVDRHAEGVICLSACLGGEIPQAILAGNQTLAAKLATLYAEAFPGRFFLELQHNGLPEQEKVNDGLKELASKLGLPLVATTDTHYLLERDERLHDVWVASCMNARLDDPHRFRYSAKGLFLKSPAEMEQAFKDDPPEALANTGRIAELCAGDFSSFFDGEAHLFPSVELPEGETDPAAACTKLAEKGLEAYLKTKPELDGDAYRARLACEMEVIRGKGFSSYFLAVKEVVCWAKENGILVGPGRGSAGGSLAAFCLGITKVDPLRFGLIFERFLNPERMSLPDIDVDFEDTKREAIITHLREKYGEEKVARISASSKCQMREVVLRVGKAHGLTRAQCAEISNFEWQLKDVPEGTKPTLKEVYEGTGLKAFCERNPLFRRVVEDGLALEGLRTHTSVHASGVLVADRPIAFVTPLRSSSVRGCRQPCTLFDYEDVERQGGVKFDILGLRTLSQVHTCLDFIEKGGKEVPNLEDLDFEEDEVFELFRKGEVDAVFQAESEGMRQTLTKISPTSFEDLVAGIALYRPGALGNASVDAFIKRKHGKEPVSYPHHLLEGCLQGTYGVFVFQEQVMKAAQVIAGFSLGEADILRKAMGKKKLSVMEAQREKFLAGALKRGLTEAEAEGIFDLLASFAGYGFNRSHAVAYAILAYQTAWLKLHHPCEFMSSVLDARFAETRAELKPGTPERKKARRLERYLAYCHTRKIKVLLPSVNAPSERSVPTPEGCIQLPLTAIKGVGEKAAQKISAARELGLSGEFSSLDDFRNRTFGKKSKSLALPALIGGGALDFIGKPRLELLRLLGPSRFTKGLPETEEEARRFFERDLFGTYVKENPLSPYAPLLLRLGLRTVRELPKRQEDAEQDIYAVGAIARGFDEKADRSGRAMLFLTFADESGLGRATVFASLLKSQPGARRLLEGEAPLLLKLRPNCYRGSFGFILERVVPLSAWLSSLRTPFPVTWEGVTEERARAVREIFARHAGETPLEVVAGGKRLPLKNYKISLSPAFFGELEDWERANPPA